VIVYAVWGIDTNGNGRPDVLEEGHSITYDVNGGNDDGPAAETDLLPGNHTLSSAKPSHPLKDGSNVLFMGWSFSKAGVLAYGDSVPALVISVTITTDDITVYAVWGIDTNGNGIPDVLEDPNPPEAKQYYITSTADNGSIVSPSGTVKVPGGYSVQFTFKAKDGYKIVEVLIDGLHKLTQEQIDSGSYTFTNIMANHTIVVKSAPDSGSGGEDGNAGGDINTGGGGSDSSRIGGSQSWLGLLFAIAALFMLCLILLQKMRARLFLTIVMGEAVKDAAVTYRVDKDGKSKNGTMSSNSKGKLKIYAKKNSIITISTASKDGHEAVGLPRVVVMEQRREHLEILLK